MHPIFSKIEIKKINNILMEVFISIDSIFDILFLAKKWRDFKTTGEKQDFIIISFSEAKKTTPILEDKINICEELGGKIITLDSIDNFPIKEGAIFYIHTFGFAEKSFDIAKQFKAHKVIAYSDGYKNEYVCKFMEKSNIIELLCFGWLYQKDDNYFKKIENIECLSFKHIKEFAQYFRSKLGIETIKIPKNSLLIVSRYWDIGPYLLTKGLSYGGLVKRILQGKGLYEIENVIIKNDYRTAAHNMKSLTRNLIEDKKSVSFVHEYVKDSSDKIDYIPFELLLDPNYDNPTFFFDSSVATILSVLTNAKLFFINNDDVKCAFQNKEGYKTINTYNTLYRRFVEENKNCPLDSTPVVMQNINS